MLAIDAPPLLATMISHSLLPISVSTAGSASRYLGVNKHYLALLGHQWQTLNQKSLTEGGGAIDDEARTRRLWMLEDSGSYSYELALVRHASGQSVPVIISAQRTMVGGEAVDIEFFTPVLTR